MERKAHALNALGFTASEERWPELIGRLWKVGDAYTEGGLDVRCWKNGGIVAWLAKNPDGRLDGSAFGLDADPGMYAILAPGAEGGTANMWVYPHQGGEVLYPLLVQSPQFWFPEAVAKGEVRGWTSLVMLATFGKFHASEVEMRLDEDLTGVDIRTFVPTGLLKGEGKTPTTEGYLIGRIVSAGKARNGMCSTRFHILRVDTLGGEVTVAMAEEPGLVISVGEWIAVGGLMYAATSSLMKAIKPLPGDRSDDSGTPEGADRTDGRLRELCVGYFAGEEFTDYFEGLHLDPKRFGVTKALSWVMLGKGKEIRSAPDRMGFATPELRARYREMAVSAPIVLAPVVMANHALLEGGRSAPALVLICLDQDKTREVLELRSELKRILFGYPENDLERELQQEFEDEIYIFSRRRRLPAEIAGELEVYATDLQIDPCALGTEGLVEDGLLCLAEAGPDGITIVIPHELLQEAMGSVREEGPPPLQR